MSEGTASPELLSVREAARRLDVHENTVRNWVRDGVLTSTRVAGSTYHRFAPEEIERLLRERSKTDEASQISYLRQPVGPELSMPLSSTSGRLPTLARLTYSPSWFVVSLATTEGITNLSVRAGKGTSAPGWDGTADAYGVPFLPNGRLRIEMGVNARPKQKADEDYRKRVQELGQEPMVFVFVTPRRWSRKSAWESVHRDEHLFAEVRVLDADDLETWLEASPAVHHWFSEKLGRRPDDAQTLEQWWRRFRARTMPAMPRDVLLAGRDTHARELNEFLSRPAGAVTVRSSWRDESVAFVAAAVEREADESETVQPVLVVESGAAWNRLAREPGRMALMPLFDDADISLALEQGHHVVTPADANTFGTGAVIDLPKPSRREAHAAFMAAEPELDHDDANRYAALARRSPRALVRQIARDRNFQRPPWARGEFAARLAPLVLAGAWHASASDLAVVSELAGEPWDQLEQLLATFAASDDPPFSMVGGEWHLNSPDEAKQLLLPQLTSSALARWERVIESVLLLHDPRLDLAPDERWTAGLMGISRAHSGNLRRGLAEGIALLSSLGNKQLLTNGRSGGDQALVAVRRLLSHAGEDPAGQIWASLTDVMPLLAEGSPQAFNEAVETDLESSHPALRFLFQDGRNTSALFSSSPHTGLLWALETICWSPENLVDACMNLARLAVVDPGGKLGNRPAGSLVSVLVPWVRHTAAGVNIRVDALQEVCNVDDEVGWHLVLALWPSGHATSSPPHPPRFRDWSPDSPQVPISDWLIMIDALADAAIAFCEADPRRWGALFGRLGRLPDGPRERVMAAAQRQLLRGDLTDNIKSELWKVLRDEMAHHGEFAHADWAMNPVDLERLKGWMEHLRPEQGTDRLAYLFGWRPRSPELPDTQAEEYNEELLKQREQAVSEVMRTEGIQGLRRLAAASQASHNLGWILGGLAPREFDDDLIKWLDDESDGNVRNAAGFWARRVVQDRGVNWLEQWLTDSRLPEERRLNLALSVERTAQVWDLIERLPRAVRLPYWENFDGHQVAPDGVERAVRSLLRHKAPRAAVSVLTSALLDADDPAGMSVELVRDVVATAINSADVHRSGSQTIGYELGQLLDYLARHGMATEELAGFEFLLFRLLESYRTPSALFKTLSRDPDQFVELVQHIYRAKHEPKGEPSAVDQAFARVSWEILNAWKTNLPGVSDGGEIDETALAAWVRAARDSLAESGRIEAGDRQIGQVLARLPADPDDLWPAAAARDLLELIGSDDLISGVSTEAFNSVGVRFSDPHDGGSFERELATRYRRWAKQTTSTHRRTSRMLRDLAQDYERLAQNEDTRAAWEADSL